MRDGDRIEERDPKMDAEWLRVIANQADEIDTDADNQTLWPETADNLRDIADYLDRERVATSEDVERVARALVRVLNPDCEDMGWDLYVGDAIAALHAMGYTLQDEVKE